MDVGSTEGHLANCWEKDRGSKYMHQYILHLGKMNIENLKQFMMIPSIYIISVLVCNIMRGTDGTSGMATEAVDCNSDTHMVTDSCSDGTIKETSCTRKSSSSQIVMGT